MAALEISTSTITVKGKGGLVCSVPINLAISDGLQELLTRTTQGQKLFVTPADKTHLAIHRLENFICYYCSSLQDEGSERTMTFHGLRHSYAAEQYEKRIDGGMTPLGARRQVARLLGHGRDSVTRIYTVSVENK